VAELALRVRDAADPVVLVGGRHRRVRDVMTVRALQKRGPDPDASRVRIARLSLGHAVTLHLAPGVLTVVAFIVVAGVFRGRAVPPQLALLVAILALGVPVPARVPAVVAAPGRRGCAARGDPLPAAGRATPDGDVGGRARHLRNWSP
jgi:hypothetical protein